MINFKKKKNKKKITPEAEFIEYFILRINYVIILLIFQIK